MPGQHHRERDRCEHHIQVKADVEEAQSSFGAEAFRPSFALWTVPARHIRTHLELTGGSSPHVSVVEPAFGGCEIGVEIARFRTIGCRFELALAPESHLLLQTKAPY